MHTTLTNIKLNTGDEIILLPLTEISDNGFTMYTPKHLPIVGEYDGYDGIQNIKEDSNTQHISREYDVSIEDFCKQIVHNYLNRDMLPDHVSQENKNKVFKIKYLVELKSVYDEQSKYAKMNLCNAYDSLSITKESIQLVGFKKVTDTLYQYPNTNLNLQIIDNMVYYDESIIRDMDSLEDVFDNLVINNTRFRILRSMSTHMIDIEKVYDIRQEIIKLDNEANKTKDKHARRKYDVNISILFSKECKYTQLMPYTYHDKTMHESLEKLLCYQDMIYSSAMFYKHHFGYNEELYDRKAYLATLNLIKEKVIES